MLAAPQTAHTAVPTFTPGMAAGSTAVHTTAVAPTHPYSCHDVTRLIPPGLARRLCRGLY